MVDSFLEFCGDSIFNESLLLNNSYPKFTDCFQNTLLVWVPCGWVWITLPVYLYYLLVKADGVPLAFSCLNMSKMSFSLVLFFLAIVNVIYDANSKEHGENPTTAVFLAGSIKAATFLLTALIIQLERIKGFITSGILCIFWFLLTVAEIIPFYTYIIEETYNQSLFKFTLFYIYYGLVLFQFILHCIAEKRIRQEHQGLGKPPCPEVEASFLSRISFWWMNSLTIIGFRREIEETDLWELNPRDHSSQIHPPFIKAWETEIARCRQSVLKNSATRVNGDYSKYSESTPLLSGVNSNHSADSDTVTFREQRQKQQEKKLPSLFKVLVKVFGLTILASWGCKLLYDVLQFASPLILNVLIGYVENKNSEYKWKGFVYASSFFVVAMTQSLFSHQNFQISMTCGMQIKSALIAAIYKKAITMNNESRKSSTVGEIVNLMSVDCERVQMVVGYLWMVWSSPLQIALAITLLYYSLGPSVFAGLGVLILLIPINAVLAMKQRKLQVQQMRLKDSRIKLMNEVLNGIKVLKLYAWELSFQKKVLEIRAQELANLKKLAYLSAVTTIFWTTAPFLVTLATFTTYILSSESHYLDARKAFVSLSLFNILRFPINLLPQMLSYIVQCLVSIKRIGKFLSLDDLNPDNVTHLDVSDSAIKVENGTFRWDKDLQPQLKNITLEIPEGKLVAVVGQVGSGKSSLISAFVGEMEKLSGKVFTKGSIAYVSQQAWIQNSSLKDNILFFKPNEEHKYQEVLEACALLPDLDILPAGDMTEIGEKGINLSGGQKQRVSLARAVYNNADIYLMDDPLSAVDSHVGKHIFNKVIGQNGLLRNKTRVLVTHGVQWLPVVDTIVVLVNGEITEVGSYEELLTHDGAFAQFLKTYLRQEEEEDEDPDIQKIKSQILEKVDSVTSDGTGVTSGDDDKGQVRRRKKRLSSESSIGTTPMLAKSTDGQPQGGDKSETTKMMPGKPGNTLIEKEKAETGQVKWSVYLTYFKAVGGFSTLLIFGTFALYNAASIGSNVWLSLWTDDKYLKENFDKANSTEYKNKNYLYLGIYGAFGLAQAIIILIYSLLYAVRAIRASAHLHESMLAHILRSPMEFFETTPTGRIVNRFSRDVETIDNTLPMNLRMWMNLSFATLSTIAVIGYSTPIFLSVTVPLAILYYLVQRFYIPTARQLKRIESTTRSPIYTQFGETLTGASTIRAYDLSQTFIDLSRDKVDYNLVSYYAGIVSNRWLGLRLEFLGNFIIVAAAMFAVVSDSTTGGLVGLSISYALQVTGVLNFLVRTNSDLETSAVSVERIKEYTETKSEADWIVYFRRPPHNWPQEGDVQFENYSTRYREGLDLVLKGITCDIKGGEKIGIVGRTGAGKSSFTVALFRLIEAAGGAIYIDGQRISDIGLHDLRSKLTILPQDPVLFSGTLRMNLDPFDSYTDVQIWTALEHAHLKNFVSDLPEGLNHECGEGGQNLSVGQRQLVCLARTLLHKTKILILDEATAAVDMETDDLIQKTIRTEFKECTVLTIAHRLNTIMDYDRIIVLDLGLIKEFDKPETLLKNKSSVFYAMAKDADLIHGES